MKKYLTIVFLGIILAILICLIDNYTENYKYITVDTILQEAFLTDEGYTADIASHMPLAIFQKLNVYEVYGLKDRGIDNNEQVKVAFALEESYQFKIFPIVLVKMHYTIEIKDFNNQVIGGSYDVPMILVVKKSYGDNHWDILKKIERA